MKLTRRSSVVLVAVGALLLIAASGVYLMTARGFSARDRPTYIETAIARQFRHMGMPRGGRERVNPVPVSPEAVRAGLEHWADHCAMCHANNGSGDTAIGRNLYPPAPDMRLEPTQHLSDGELFYIIENGIRLTGMPAWGTGNPDSEAATWKLVRFMRHLPKLTQAEVEAMEHLNPRSPLADEQRRREEEFLKGGGDFPAPTLPAAHGHGQKR